MLSILLVDDEPLARAGLRLLLDGDAEIGAVAEARDGREAIAAIRAGRPDLVFLDVQMPDVDGFAVVRAIGAERMPATVFVTAHDRYALQAFDASAIDYLLKPVTRDRFATALARAKARLHADDAAPPRHAALLEALAARDRPLRRIAVRAGERTLFVDVDAIDYVQAAENYVELHLGGTSHLVATTMAALERALDPDRFVRIHRSIIVQVARIRELAPAAHGEYHVVLASGARLRSGRTYAERLRALATNPF